MQGVSLEIQIMINAIHADVLAIKRRAPETACPKEFWKAVISV
jgi:hypothetical protein